LDNTRVNTQLPNAPQDSVYTTCNPELQGISVGWGDRYGYLLDGQSLDFRGNSSGDYLLTIEVNPQRNLVESNYGDNISCALLRIDVSQSSVQVLDTTCNSAPGASVTIDSISPNEWAAASQTTVTILGSGFDSLATPVDIHFNGGSGKAPLVTGIQVLSDTEITATVTIAGGGPRSDSVWDLYVGPDVLSNAFTVLR